MVHRINHRLIDHFASIGKSRLLTYFLMVKWNFTNSVIYTNTSRVTAAKLGMSYNTWRIYEAEFLKQNLCYRDKNGHLHFRTQSEILKQLELADFPSEWYKLEVSPAAKAKEMVFIIEGILLQRNLEHQSFMIEKKQNAINTLLLKRLPEGKKFIEYIKLRKHLHKAGLHPDAVSYGDLVNFFKLQKDTNLSTKSTGQLFYKSQVTGYNRQQFLKKTGILKITKRVKEICDADFDEFLLMRKYEAIPLYSYWQKGKALVKLSNGLQWRGGQ